MMFTGFTRVILLNSCTGPRKDETHHHHRTTVDHPTGMKVVLAEDGDTLKIFLSDETA